MTEPFGLYIHVPFCATRCGYCDFNTYTPGELGSPRDLTGPYLDALDKELEMAAGRGYGLHRWRHALAPGRSGPEPHPGYGAFYLWA